VENNISQIYQTLQKLIGYHRQLLDLVRLEREALTNADLKGIQDSTCAKEGVIEMIKQAESQRLSLTQVLSKEWKIPFVELTLSNIIIQVQGFDQKSAEMLRSSYNALLLLIKRTAEQNQDNRALIERSLEHVHAMKKNVLGEGSPRSDTYTQQGQRSNPSAGSRLLSQEA
jgi:flagellar biosynthesis/type III secretory pathway chaperone